MSTVVRAAVLRGHDKPFTIEDVTLGDLRDDEVLVRIVGVGMCHTDLLPRDPAMAAMLTPAILGHEGSGIVEQTGSAVTLVQVGDHVLISFDSCGHCASCRNGAPAYCDQFEARNLTARRPDGSTGATSASGEDLPARWFAQSSFAEAAITTERNLVVVDRDLPLELLGPLGCGLQTGAGSVLNEMRLAPGQSLAVFGAGAVGLAAVMAAKLAGAREIVVVDITQSRLDLALELGATRVVLGTDADVRAAVVGDGPGMDFSFETTAVSSVLNTAVAVLARPGKAVLVGAGGGELHIAPMTLSGRSVTFVLEGSAVPQLLIPLLIDFWQRGLFPFEKLTRTYAFADINQAESDSRSGVTIKPVLLTGASSTGR